MLDFSTLPQDVKLAIFDLMPIIDKVMKAFDNSTDLTLAKQEISTIKLIASNICKDENGASKLMELFPRLLDAASKEKEIDESILDSNEVE